MFHYTVIFILGMGQGAIMLDWLKDKQLLRVKVTKGKR